MRVVSSMWFAIAVMTFVLAAFWMAGFDFDERGPAALLCFVTTVSSGLLCFSLSMFLTDER